MVSSPKLILTIVWNPAWFHVVDVLPNGVCFCSPFYLSHITDPLLAGLQPKPQHPFRKPAIHADGARVQTSKMVDEYLENHRLQRADHLPNSPNLAP
jgi:hypothetical protein